MRIIILFILGALFITSCDNSNNTDSNSAIIKGQLTKSKGETLYLMELSADDLFRIDSVVVDGNGRFKFKFEMNESPELYVIRSNHFNQSITLLVKQGESIKVNGDLPTLNEEYQISGSKGSERVHKLTELINGRMAKVSAYYNTYRDNPDSMDMAVLRAQTDSLLQINQIAVYNEIRNFIKEDPSSLSSLLALYSRFGRNAILDDKLDADLFQMVSDSLITKYPNSSHAMKLHQKVLELQNEDQLKKEREEALSVGKKFPDLVLNDIDDNPQYLYRCKAKVCIVAVWISTNKESWDMNAKLRDIYKSYHDKGLDIYEVSFDTDKLAWANYCHMDKLIWTNVIGYPREKSMLNAEDKMPRLFLLDANKKILAKDPTMQELEVLLKENL